MTRGRTIGCVAAALACVALGLVAWHQASTEQEVGPQPRAPRGFPSRFAQKQSATQRGTAPYVLTLAADARKVDALLAVKACGARVVCPRGPNAFLVETSIFALGKLTQNTNFTSAAELLPTEKVKADFAGGWASVRVLAEADRDRVAAFLREKGLSPTNRVEGARRGELVAEIPSEILPSLTALGEVREVSSVAIR